jgi:hypothetical protein
MYDVRYRQCEVRGVFFRSRRLAQVVGRFNLVKGHFKFFECTVNVSCFRRQWQVSDGMRIT